MKTVLFACVHNAGRSQMAAALEVMMVMQEVGIDLSAVQPQRLTPELASQADLLITMGCGEELPRARTDQPRARADLARARADLLRARADLARARADLLHARADLLCPSAYAA